MSETIKTVDATKRATDQTTRFGQAAIDTAGRSAKETIGATAQAAQNATERAREASQGMAETVAESAQAATDMSSKAAEQSRDAMITGARTVAGAGGRLADMSFGRGQQMLASTVQAMDIYRDASERSAERLQALFSTAVRLSRGMQSMQHAWLEMLDNSIENATHKPQDLLRCKTVVELAEVQRDLYVDAINHAFESTSRLLEIAGRTAQDAVRPLQQSAS